jgi:glucose/arabinose dehydrogenase
MKTHSFYRAIGRRLLFASSTLALAGWAGVLAPPQAQAQACALPTAPIFAGHNLPLDSDPVPEAMHFVRAFPALDYTSLVGLYAAPDDSDRLFAVERNGRIHVFENQDDVASSRVFLDIDAAVDSDASEQGLLGLAFDPDYATNRRFFVNYTASLGCAAPGNAGCSKIVRFEADPADPDRALPNSAFPILEFPQPFDNHNGGAIAFGPDGLLYIATGDGGSGGDPFRNAQNLASRLGKILRLDVRASAPSIVPATNPYVGVAGTDPLIYHSGLRNPWRMTFDRGTGDLLIADVGQSRREEVHRVRAGGAAGQNFGWDYCEGTRDYRSGALCNDIQSTPPVLEYDHNAPVGGEVIIGGYVYRGDAFAELFGAYLLADAASGHVWAWDGQDPVDPWNPGNPAALIGSAPAGIASFGEDREGELYAVSSVSGQIFRLMRSDPGGGGPAFPALLSQTGLFSSVFGLTAAPGMIEYDITTPLWSDGASKRRWMALPREGRITFHAREAWEYPVGTVFVKHFELPRIPSGSRRVETRVFLRQTTRWIGVTYRWNAAATDATLQTDALDETIDLGSGAQQTWHYPSTSECLGCHTEVSGRVLGARTRQLQGPRTYAQGTQPQIDAWSCAGLFDFDIGDRGRYEFGRAITDTTATRTHRVRSYAAANCEMCHQPGGPAPGDLDLRFTRAVGQWNVIDVPPSEGDLGFPNARRILPGNRFLSTAWLRQAVSDVSVRMARGTLRADTPATNLIGDWILTDVATVDSDGDGVADATDVCPAVADPLQADGDGDSIGDRCDPDALADLVVAAQSTPTGTVFPAQPLSFSATLENIGTGAAGTFPVTFYLSANALLEPAIDVPVGHCWANALAGGATTTCSTSTARIPASFQTGSPGPVPYRWITCANRAEVERDADPANACTVSSTSVTVPEPRAMLVVALASLAFRARARSRKA